MSARPKERLEIRLAGSGGQGMILAGIILAEAAAIYDGLDAVQTQTYGPESRGGATKAEVIVSRTGQEIDYPKVTSPDVVLAMNQESYDKYSGGLGQGSVVVVDSGFVEKTKEGPAKVYPLRITDVAIEAAGRAIVANIVALGAIVGLTGVVSREAITQAVLARVPKGTEEMNKKALEAGFAAVASLR